MCFPTTAFQTTFVPLAMLTAWGFHRNPDVVLTPLITTAACAGWAATVPITVAARASAIRRRRIGAPPSWCPVVYGWRRSPVQFRCRIAGLRRGERGLRREDDDVERVALERDVPAFESRIREAGRLRRPGPDQDLARGGRGRQVRRQVHRIAERREVADATGGHHPHEGEARVDTEAERDPRAFRGPVADRLPEPPGDLDGASGVLGPGHEREEEGRDLIADELLDDRVAIHEHLA